jgi:serine/threonine protein kinase
MECGAAGHILVSNAAAELLSQIDHWGEMLHRAGELDGANKVQLQVFNLCKGGLGNHAIPDCFSRAKLEAKDPLVGKSVNHYLVLEKLGAGGMGVVYKAKDIRLDRNIAIKFLARELSSHGSHLERFQREARAASSLNHANICTLHDVGDWNGWHFIVMELLEGWTLKELMLRKPLAMEQILQYGTEIAQALEAAHVRSIVHRDVKPANIFVNAQGQIKVLDFGLAKVERRREVAAAARVGNGANGSFATLTAEESATSSGEFVGTVAYMSPEQARGEELDGRSDLFSFGVVLYQMATGVLPFRGDTSAVIFDGILNRTPAPATSINPQVPRELELIINRALQKDRGIRYQTAAEICVDLQSLCAQLKHKPIHSAVASAETAAGEIAILYKRNVQPDEQLLQLLEGELVRNGYRVFIDRHLLVGMEWAREIESRICRAEAVIPLLSESSVKSEMLAYEVEIAHEAAQRQNGKPRILPIRVNFSDPLPDTMSATLDRLQYAEWKGSADNPAIALAILDSLRNPQDGRRALKLETVGGAVPLDSAFYIVRPTDDDFLSAIAGEDSIVLIKGARQMGKTSLLARGLSEARKARARVVLTDFQKLNAAHLETIDSFFLALADSIAEQLGFDDLIPEQSWNPRRGPSMNFDRFLRREILSRVETRLVWGMDEVDRLFSCKFASEAFGLFRSWHNERSLDPTGPWQKLTMAIAYATEAHLFITDINQSPFNVGTRLFLEDFTPEQVAELNRRYGHPLKNPGELKAFHELLAGHPYLTRRGLHEMASRAASFEEFSARAGRDEGPFGDHLRRVLVMLAQQQSICDVVRAMLAGRQSGTPEDFYRLRSSGIVLGEPGHDMRIRCRLYESYLKQHLS